MRASTPHLSSAQVADLLDERLEPDDRDAVITHLAACADCRHEVAELHGALAVVGDRRPRRRWIAGLAIVAAAAVAFVAIPPRMISHRAARDDASETRNAEGAPLASVARIGVVAPGEGDQLSTAGFVWKSVGGGSSYLLTVQDTAGSVVWTTTVTDTTAVPPPSAKLAPGARYFWSVDARLGDGSSSTSGAHSFVSR